MTAKRLGLLIAISIPWLAGLWISYWSGFDRSYVLMHSENVQQAKVDVIKGRELLKILSKDETKKATEFIAVDMAQNQLFAQDGDVHDNFWVRIRQVVLPFEYLEFIRIHEGTSHGTSKNRAQAVH